MMKSSTRRPRSPLPSVHLSTLTVLAVAAAVTAAATVCVAVFASVYSRTMQRNAQLTAEQAARQATLAVDNYLRGAADRLDRICTMLDTYFSAEEWQAGMEAVAAAEPNVYAVMVYDTEGGLLGCAGGNSNRKQTVYRNLSFDRELMESVSPYAVSAPHVQTLFENQYPWVVTIARRQTSRLFGESVYVAVDFRFSELAQYIDRVGVGPQGYCYVAAPSGEAVYHPQQQLLFSGLKQEPSRKAAAQGAGIYTEQDAIYAVSDTADSVWRVVCVSHTEELAVERREQILLCLLISALSCAAVSGIALWLYARVVTAPVRELTQAMKALERAPEQIALPEHMAVTELQELSDSFAHMAQRIHRLLDQIREEQTALRKTELKALQAQINPHFLYNTLDSIQWMCEQGNTEDAVRMIGALARLFRISISRGHELIPLRDELMHARSYLIIQSYRYRHQFTYRFETDESLNAYLCHKITIQPLIENAIYHGIDRMVDEGEIVIRTMTAPDDDGDILIVVEDNGVGMTEEQCRKILQKERSDSQGIGVKNVNDRLQIYFGEKYGLTIRSEPDVGTAVTVRLPKVTKEADYAL